ncbi:hypothetical protein DCAR_0415993 [Daucus carota subsp. sativus]|uniref:Uncharacterized protein n=1 Tax=Daucus carota subsp. sativus TaxID=79200 RepID=A0AAF0WVP2_DAUCS|nr:hypothetical protein DCAR_0415993 [Daucus carota subsp. sativus]
MCLFCFLSLLLCVTCFFGDKYYITFLHIQGDGWPLGLQPFVRVGLVMNSDLNGSVSSNTLLTASTSAESYSSDLDTESTSSFFHDKTISLGSLIGASSIVGLSRRSAKGRASETFRDKKQYKPKPWLFSICSKLTTDAVTTNRTPSLGHFLEVERRTANIYKRNQSLITYCPGDFSYTSSNPSFHSGYVDPPNRPSPWTSSDDERSNAGLFEDSANEYRTPLLFSCLRRSMTQ